MFKVRSGSGDGPPDPGRTLATHQLHRPSRPDQPPARPAPSAPRPGLLPPPATPKVRGRLGGLTAALPPPSSSSSPRPGGQNSLPGSEAPQARGVEGLGSGRVCPTPSSTQRPGLTSPAAWRSSSKTACYSRQPLLGPRKGLLGGPGGPRRDAPRIPQSEGQPRPLPRRGSTAPCSWGRHLGCGHPPTQRRCHWWAAGRWSDEPIRSQNPVGR